MSIYIVHLSSVDSVAGILVSLVGDTQVYGIGACQFSIHMVVGAGARKQIDFERLAFFMKLSGFLSQSHCYNLGSTRRGKAGKSHIVSIIDVAGSFFSCNKRDTHL